MDSYMMKIQHVPMHAYMPTHVPALHAWMHGLANAFMGFANAFMVCFKKQSFENQLASYQYNNSTSELTCTH